MLNRLFRNSEFKGKTMDERNRKNTDNPAEDARETGRVRSVVKALHILELFSPAQTELSLSQLSRLLSMPKSTLLNMLRTLEDEGYLLHLRDTQAYRLGYKALQLGFCMRSSMPVIQYAIPFMEDLMTKTGETVYLTSHMNGMVLYLDGVYNSRRFGKYSITGKTLPLHCTGCGKAMLSRMEDVEIRAIIKQHGLVRFTPHTIVDPEALMREVRETRARGYAIDNEEETPGVRCVATAILNEKGRPVGAVSIQGTTMSMTDEKIVEYAPLTASVCAILSENARLFPAHQLTLGRVVLRA